uniref:Rheb3 n=1 Tax=Hemistasia phaeocysticola TaxID=1503927 RepID=A0A2R4IKX1_9EUGL|nr:Rheb3 [Hemistasia phaeocysticola]
MPQCEGGASGAGTQRTLGQTRGQWPSNSSIDGAIGTPMSPDSESDVSSVAALRKFADTMALAAESFVRQRKVCVFGSRACGKTSLVFQFANGVFRHEHSLSTNRSLSRSLDRHGRQFQVQVLDTAGQDDLGFFDPSYTIGTDGYMLVYSVTDKESFKMVQRIYEELWAYTPLVPFILVANKVDLATQREVTAREGQRLARQWGCHYFESTAKDADCVHAAFEALLAQIDGSYEQMSSRSPTETFAPTESAVRFVPSVPQRSKDGCSVM